MSEVVGNLDNYRRIEKAIHYLIAHHQEQPSLKDVAQEVCLSEAHLQRLFTQWVGASPKKFLQFININYARYLMQQKQTPTLFDITDEVGLSSSSRLHDLFVSIEGMTPAEYRDGGKDLTFKFSIGNSILGDVLVISTDKGICKVVFLDEGSEELELFKQQYPKATYINEQIAAHQQVMAFLQGENTIGQIKLHLRGTAFQMQIWEALLQIPEGQLTTYGAIANQIGNSKASRAVGTAIGANPIAYLIPCHRVIQQSGVLGGYRWGLLRKQVLISKELLKRMNS